MDALWKMWNTNLEMVVKVMAEKRLNHESK